MEKKISLPTVDPVWARVTSISIALFFITFSDAILSYWIPGFMQNALGSALLMGLVMSFSSLVGFAADVVFPQLLANSSVKKLIIYAIITSIVFSLALLLSIWQPFILFLLFAMFAWGVYYEFLGFANQQFVAETVPREQRSGAWAVIRLFKDLAYFLGPLLAVAILEFGDYTVVLVATIITIISYFVFMLLKLNDKKIGVKLEEINLVKELSHWKVLLHNVWPIIVLSLILGIIDSVFWTTGAVWSETLSQESSLGGFFLPFYTLPTLFMSFVMVKLKISTQKKKLSQLFMLLSGIFLTLLGLNADVEWQLLCVFASSTMLAITYPLSDAVYSDILARMGRERKHLIGLSSSTVSIAYIFGPVIAGIITSLSNAQMTFTYTGIGVIIFAMFLLIVTPKKLKLSQKDIKNW